MDKGMERFLAGGAFDGTAVLRKELSAKDATEWTSSS